ncbi:MAG: methyltransferase domain-containing protein [Sneathiella sp.]
MQVFGQAKYKNALLKIYNKKTDMTAVKTPSPWVKTHYSNIAAGGSVLDLACGSGRHTCFLQEKGYQLTAVDRDITALHETDLSGVNLRQADLEDGPWPFEGELFEGIIVVNYLWRPLFSKLVESLTPGGVLIYDTFCLGNEAYGRPKNPDFLLRPGELKTAFSDLTCLEFNEGLIENPAPAVRQSIVARKP